MNILSKEEAEELLFWSKSKSLKRDMRKIRQNQYGSYMNDPDYINKYIKFLTFINSLAGHPQKKFKKLTGNSFKI